MVAQPEKENRILNQGEPTMATYTLSILMSSANELQRRDSEWNGTSELLLLGTTGIHRDRGGVRFLEQLSWIILTYLDLLLIDRPPAVRVGIPSRNS